MKTNHKNKSRVTKKRRGFRRRRNGGDAIASGTYGCVFRPALQCDDSTIHTGVSKLMNARDAEDEYREIKDIKKILSKIKNAEDYFIANNIEHCKKLKPLNRKDIQTAQQTCTNIHTVQRVVINQNLKKYNLLQLPDGGTDLQKWIEHNHTLDNMLDFNVKIIELLENAIVPMNKLGLYHFDLKDSNILVGQDGKFRIIDWGLSQQPGMLTLELDFSFLSFNIPINSFFFYNRSEFQNILVHDSSLERLMKSLDVKVQDIHSHLSKKYDGGFYDKIGHMDFLEEMFSSIYHTKYTESSIIDMYIKYIATTLFNYCKEFPIGDSFEDWKGWSLMYKDFIKTTDIWGLLTVYTRFLTLTQYQDLDTYNSDVYNKIREIVVRFLYEYPTYYNTSAKRKMYLSDIKSYILKINSTLTSHPKSDDMYKEKSPMSVTELSELQKQRSAPMSMSMTNVSAKPSGQPMSVSEPKEFSLNAIIESSRVSPQVLKKASATKQEDSLEERLNRINPFKTKKIKQRRCPNGTRRNPKTDECISKSAKTKRRRRCPNGTRWNVKENRCL